MKYYQCCECKKLKETPDIIVIEDITCHDRRMRELNLNQYNHEVAQRAWIDGGMKAGEEPKNTDLMIQLGINK
jgi:hypothetical protein